MIFVKTFSLRLHLSIIVVSVERPLAPAEPPSLPEHRETVIVHYVHVSLLLSDVALR